LLLKTIKYFIDYRQMNITSKANNKYSWLFTFSGGIRKMKKIVVSISLCCLLLLFSVTAAYPIHQKISDAQITIPSHQSYKMDDPPGWANGNFTGVWGITLFGVPLDPAGWITGYYENIGFGQVDAVYGTNNEADASSFLRGYMLWIYFLGFAGSIQTGNGTWVIGLGTANETHFYCRINAIIGPSFYIICQYMPFEKETV
jgi:hypothetical protein